MLSRILGEEEVGGPVGSLPSRDDISDDDRPASKNSITKELLHKFAVIKKRAVQVHSVLPRPFWQGAAPCPFLVTPCPF